MIKKLFLTIFILAAAISGCSRKKAAAKDACIISIEAQGYPVDSILLIWTAGNEFKQEIIRLKEGKGETEVKVPDLSSLLLINSDISKSVATGDDIIPAPMFAFFAENGHRVNIRFDNNDWPVVEISGGTVNNDYMRLLKETGTLEKGLFERQAQVLVTRDTALQNRLNKELEGIQDQILNKQKDFLKANTSSYASLFTLQGLVNKLPFDEFEKYFTDLDGGLRDTPLGRQVTEYIENAKKTGLNQPAPDFEKQDKDGKIIKLSDYKGKYVLMDFWGSWCGPCRISHPHLAGLYKEYSCRGLQFIGIAQENTDDGKDWQEALEKDGLIWPQILNNIGIDRVDVVSLYNITAFPTKILIGPDGKIAGRYTGTELDDLDAKLAEIFGG